MFGHDEASQIWILFWIVVGVIASWIKLKFVKVQGPVPIRITLGKMLDELTLKGFFKKLVIAVVAWGFFLAIAWYTELIHLSHIALILPSFGWGYVIEWPLGGVVQQKIENKYHNNHRTRWSI